MIEMTKKTHRKPKTAVSMIKEAITDEKHGSAFYKKLAGKLTEPEEKKRVLKIARQECKHRKIMKELKKDIEEKDDD